MERDTRTDWAVVLAGGDGVRLRPLTRLLTGDDRPKQFCRLLGAQTLLEQTLGRCRLAVPPQRTLTVVTEPHRRFYGDLVPRGLSRLLAQPENRGTAPAILLGLLRVAAAAPTATVAVLPSDHYVSDDGAFMRHVDAALGAARARAELVILLGLTPDGAEEEYGWIEPGERVPGPGLPALFRVLRFREKPAPEVARDLFRRGCLWNSFVMVAAVPAFLALIRRRLPDLYGRFLAIAPALGTPREAEALRALYREIPSANFSREVLSHSPANLAVLPVTGLAWSDLGTPRRVLALDRARISPAWAEVARSA